MLVGPNYFQQYNKNENVLIFNENVICKKVYSFFCIQTHFFGYKKQKLNTNTKAKLTFLVVDSSEN